MEPWVGGLLGDPAIPKFKSPWLRLSDSEHPGCRMLPIRPASAKLSAWSACAPAVGMFLLEQPQPGRANSPGCLLDVDHHPWKHQLYIQ